MTTCQRMHQDAEGAHTVACTNEATGSVRIEFWPHQVLQKMVKEPRPLQTMIINVKVCASCFATLRPQDVLAPATLRSLERFAMDRNHGIAPDRSQTKLISIGLDDPELLQLERTLLERAQPNG